MTKIRATKDSPLAKQGEVFDGDETQHFNICGFYCSKLSVDKWISDGWFEVVEKRETLAKKMLGIVPEVSYGKNYSHAYVSVREIDNFCTIAREHAIEIAKEAHAEFYQATYGRDSLLGDYIIQKLEERMI